MPEHSPEQASMPRCATCKHWNETPAYLNATGRRCNLLTFGDQKLVFIRVDYDYEHEVYTEPEFGCVLHEPKETDGSEAI